eukprot:TRINITY_DN13690_c0_g1_i1.p1 TRINITY_DN13690_c0_g1~~TRINITY_DN13690_c0_g1_i1.p1  ORF type:complete len:152 (-),score=27.17 TRINITY_DN13690_c0_g1_i1:39-494(-)
MKILMVCLGNICRSPLAEGILRAKLQGTGYVVDSAGTAAYHSGEKPDSRSIDIAKKKGIDISKQKARQFKQEDFDTFDRIYVMDRSNYSNVLRLAPNSEAKKKVKLILNESSPGEDKEVPDPYYGGDKGFENVYNMLDLACDKIVESFKSA